MLSAISKFSSVETLELTPDPDFTFKRFEKLSPVRAGAVVPGLVSANHTIDRHHYFDEIVLNNDVHSFSYSHKPLLLYFYEKEWGPVGLEHLYQLNAAHAELRGNNINVLVVTSGSYENYRESSWNEGWTIEVFEDNNKGLASLLHVYSDQSPTWTRYSGIEGNIPLPALYLLDNARQVAFDFPNEDILPGLPLDVIVPVLAGDAQNWQNRKSA